MYSWGEKNPANRTIRKESRNINPCLRNFFGETESSNLECHTCIGVCEGWIFFRFTDADVRMIQTSADFARCLFEKVGMFVEWLQFFKYEHVQPPEIERKSDGEYLRTLAVPAELFQSGDFESNTRYPDVFEDVRQFFFSFFIRVDLPYSEMITASGRMYPFIGFTVEQIGDAFRYRKIYEVAHGVSCFCSLNIL